jgi:ferritin-like metal-binding protein YciE
LKSFLTKTLNSILDKKFSMKKIKDLSDFLVNQLEEIRFSEIQFLKELPRLIEQTTNPELYKILKAYTKNIKNRLLEIAKIFDEIEITPQEINNEIIGLYIKNFNKDFQKSDNKIIHDISIIQLIQNLNQLRISKYGALNAFSKTLKQDKMRSFFQHIITDEKNIDNKLTELGITTINEKAKPKPEESLI